MLRTAPEAKAKNAGIRQKQRDRNRPIGTATVWTKNKEDAEALPERRVLRIFVSAGREYRKGRAPGRVPGTDEHGTLPSGGKGVPVVNRNPVSDIIPMKKAEGDREC